MTRPSTNELLDKTSRTFALAIPLLPDPTRTTVKLAYLLFRIADTLEDAEAWPRDRRLQALADFCELLKAPTQGRAEALSRDWLGGSIAPTHHDSYLELLAAMPQVMAEVEAIEIGARHIVLDHAFRTADGMREIILNATDDGHVRVDTIRDLQHYCYIVAGIVGELLTALFVNDAPRLVHMHQTLVEQQIAFGEGLQLVNILKDESVDRTEGRSYLPRNVSRSEVLSLARRDLDGAMAYIAALQKGGAPAGYVAFCSLAAQLAVASLKVLEREGPGAKVSRLEVFRIMAEVQAFAARGASEHRASA